MSALAPMLLVSGARLLIDHGGWPVPSAGLRQPGFQAALGPAKNGWAAVKLSGYQKFSAGSLPCADAKPYFDALVKALTLNACLWGPD